MRERILKTLLKNCPMGDLSSVCGNEKRLSCVFIFYRRYDLMETILYNLSSQTLDREDVEIILVEDRGGSDRGRALPGQFTALDIQYHAPERGWGRMGFMRNFGLSRARGEIVLFLDDDTVLPDSRFLEKLLHHFRSDPDLDAVMPRGHASFCLLKGRYDYHDPYFFTNRCMAYRKKVLAALGGFDSSFAGQEDVELAIRFLAQGKKALKAPDLRYFHPPLVYTDTAKGAAVGASFAASKYGPAMKAALFFNGIRWLPRTLLPGGKNQNMARFARGFFKGFLGRVLNRNKKVRYQ